jgi:hypothetical protein
MRLPLYLDLDNNENDELEHTATGRRTPRRKRKTLPLHRPPRCSEPHAAITQLVSTGAAPPTAMACSLYSSSYSLAFSHPVSFS